MMLYNKYVGLVLQLFAVRSGRYRTMLRAAALYRELLLLAKKYLIIGVEFNRNLLGYRFLNALRRRCCSGKLQ